MQILSKFLFFNCQSFYFLSVDWCLQCRSTMTANELGLDEVWKKILNEVKKDFFKFRQAHVVRRAGFFARTFNNMGVAQARCSKGGRSPPFEQRYNIRTFYTRHKVK